MNFHSSELEVQSKSFPRSNVHRETQINWRTKMTNLDIKVVTVPKEIYYHEVAYVRALEALANVANEFVTDLCQHEGAEGFSESTREIETRYDAAVAEVRWTKP